MKVKDLIEALKMLEPDHDVVMFDGELCQYRAVEGVELTYISRIGWNVELVQGEQGL